MAVFFEDFPTKMDQKLATDLTKKKQIVNKNINFFQTLLDFSE